METWKIVLIGFLGWFLLNLVLFVGRWNPDRVPARMLFKKFLVFNLVLVVAIVIIGFSLVARHMAAAG
jgi:hypothetical protein